MKLCLLVCVGAAADTRNRCWELAAQRRAAGARKQNCRTGNRSWSAQQGNQFAIQLNMLKIYPVELAAELEVTTADGWVHTVGHNSTRLNMFSFQFFYQIRRQSLWTSCEFNTHRATPTPTRLDSWVASASAPSGVYGLNRYSRGKWLNADEPRALTDEQTRRKHNTSRHTVWGGAIKRARQSKSLERWS